MSSPKILIENQNALGHNVEQVSLDTNRVNVQTETTARIANLIAVSSRGIWIDLSQWLSYSAALFACTNLALLAGVPIWALILFPGLPTWAFLTLILDTAQRRSALRYSAFIRFVLFFAGAAIAVF